MCCHCMNRREFLAAGTGMIAGAGLVSAAGAAAENRPWAPDEWNPDRPLVTLGKPLSIQPILTYATPTKHEMTSWKSWGGVQSDQTAAQEADRIAGELNALKAGASFPMEIRPVIKVKTVEEAAAAHSNPADVVIIYPATGSGRMLQACFPKNGRAIIFIRHRSGPVYYWYEALSTKILAVDSAQPDRLTINDVVVDDPQELLWRLRSYFGVRNFVGAKIVALGGAMGKYAPEAPTVATDKYKFQIVDVPYKDVDARIRGAIADPTCRARAEAWTTRYLALPGTTLSTEKGFIVNAFILYGLFKDLMRQQQAEIFTINSCMGTIMPMSKTTACLTLSLLNDEGYLALCESDFVIIPPAVLLRYVTGRPVFQHNSTFPHKGMVTCAHCTCPRRMDGCRYEPSNIVTHYESEFGAAPKVDMPKGQELTFVDPEYASGRWLGFRGTVESNPFYDICRSQQDVQIQGDWKALIREVRDSHWMMAYGDCLQEVGYAAKKIGIRWETIV